MSHRHISRVAIALIVTAAFAGCSRNDPDKFIASAETYIAKSDNRSAIIELKNALAAAPDNARARFLLGKASLDSGDPVAAATEFRKALALHHPPDDVYPLLARALVQQNASKNEILELANAPVQSARAKAEIAAMIGMAYLGYGQPKDARVQIESALALEPSNVVARTTQARLMAVESDFPGALQRIDAVLAAAPVDLDALMLKGEIEIALGRRSDSLKTLERVVALQPAAFQARYLLVTSFVQAKEFDKAAAQVDELKKLAPADARTLHAVAIVAFARGDVTTALDAVQKSLQAAPNFLPARYLSGLVDLQRGAYAAAEESLRAVLAKSPNDDGARIALAQALLRGGQAAKAQEILDSTLGRMPENTMALRLAAEVQLALKKPDKAARYLERANALDKGDIGSRVRLAEVRLAQGESGQGMRDLEALAASDPNAREPDVALISAHMRARDYDKALAAADALIKKQPQSPAAHNVRGTVFLGKRDLKSARNSFEKALALNPEFVMAKFNLASLDVAERNYAEARKRYEQIVAKDPKSERALLGLAQLDILNNASPAEVGAAIQRAVAANPDSVAARVLLINYLASRKDWKAALTAAQAAQAAIPDRIPILEGLAAVQQASGEYNQAIETYTRLAKLQPENPLPLTQVAGIHASMKNYDAAIVSLKSALVVAPDNWTIWVALAGAYKEANAVEAGFTDARRLQKEQPNRAAGFALEGELLAAQRKLPEAAAAYRTALAHQSSPLVVVRLHSLLLEVGKPDEAAGVTQKWLRDHPKDATVHAYLGQRSLAKSDYKTSAVHLRAAVEQEPENLVLLNNLAWSLSELKDPTAIEYAERAYQIAPNNASVVNTYGWILVQRGDMVRGIQHLQKSVELDPGDAGRRLYLAKALIKSGDKSGARKELEIIAKADSPTARIEAEQLLKVL